MKQIILPILLFPLCLFSQTKDSTLYYSEHFAKMEEKPAKVYASMEFLYLSATDSSLVYAQEASWVQSKTDVKVTAFDGPLQKISTKWKPSFRVSIGGFLPNNSWELFLSWQYFHSDVKNSSSPSSPTKTFVTLWGHTSHDVANNAKFASAKWVLKQDVVDFASSKTFWMGQNFSVKPLFGLEWGRIDQSFSVHYDYHQLDPTAPQISGDIIPKSNFWGVGPMVGINPQFFFFQDWSIYGKGIASILCGSLHTRFTDIDHLIDYGWTRLIGSSKEHLMRTTYRVLYGLGISWNHSFSSCIMGVSLGWEQDMWFSVNKMQHYMHKLSDALMVQENGNISLQGVVANLQMAF